MALPTFSDRFFRNSLLRVALPLLALFTANSAFAQVYSFRVTQGGTRDPLSESPVPIVSGNPVQVRVAAFEKGAAEDDPYEGFNRDVTLQIRGNYGEVVTTFIPAEEFLDGVAEFVEITPVHAGTDNMYIRVTDGNIVTDNASGYFSIAPAGFEVSYVGSGDDNANGSTLYTVPMQPLSAHDVITGQTLMLRVRAVNSDGTTATGYTGMLELNAIDPAFEDPVTTTTAQITAGGYTDDASIFFPSAAEGMTISVIGTRLPILNVDDVLALDGVIDLEDIVDLQDLLDLDDLLDPGHPVVAEDASGPFDVLEAVGGADLSVDNLELRGQVYPGSSLTLRYRLNNGTDAVITGPIDVAFRIMDGNTLISQWNERFLGDIPFDGDNPNSGDLLTSFVLPANLTAKDYSLQIRPNGDRNQGTQTLGIANLRPNLYIEDLEFAPGEYRGGEAMRFKLVFTNYPNRMTPPGERSTAVPTDLEYRIQVHLSTNNEFGDEDDFLLWEDWYAGNGSSDALFYDVLPPGQHVNIDSAFLLPTGFEGTYYILARVNSGPGRDGAGVVAEHPDSVGTTPRSGDNTTYAYESQKVTILPIQSTDTSVASVTSAEAASTGISDNPDISEDGRYIAFDSFGALAGATAAGTRNVFIRDTLSNETILVSVGVGDAAADGNSGDPSISADGRYVAFQSSASNLVADDTNGRSDIFVRDLVLGTTIRLSENPNPLGPLPGDANHGSQLASISANGQYIVFESSATNLITPEPLGLVAGRTQIYLYNRDVAGLGAFDVPGNTSITLVTKASGLAGVSPSTNPAISSDGGYVTFETAASNLLGRSAAFTQIVRWERGSNAIIPVTIGIDGFSLGNNISGSPTINGNGEYIAFASRAQNLTALYDPLTGEGDRYDQSIPHVFRARIQGGVVSNIIRMNAADGAEPNNPPTILAPDLGAYEPSLSDNGRFVAFTSESENLLPSLTARNFDRTEIEVEAVENYQDRNNVADVYLYDLLDPENPVIQRASVTQFGYGVTQVSLDDPGSVETNRPLSRRPAISGNGRYVAFTSDAEGFNGLVFGNTNYDLLGNDVRDVYLFDSKVFTEDEESDLFSIHLTASQSGAAVGEPVLFSLSVDDPAPEIANVQLYGNGVLLAAMIGDAEGEAWSWQGSINAPGEWHVHAVATDIDGNVVYSETVLVTIKMFYLTVSASQIDLGSEVSLGLVVAGGGVPLSYVDFFVNGELLSRDSELPYGATWTPDQVGQYTLSFVARNARAGTDLFGDPVTVTVQPANPPLEFRWISQASGTVRHLNDLVYAVDHFFAVGENGAVLASDAGEAWEISDSLTDSALNGIASGNGVSVAVGDGGVTFVTDEDGWSPVVSQTTSRLNDVVFGNGVFVAVGEEGRIRTLAVEAGDVSGPWIARSSGIDANLHAVTFGDGKFIAVGEGGIILVSSDGIVWDAASSDSSVPLYGIAYGNGLYVAVGGGWNDFLSSYRATVLASTDGIAWSRHDAGLAAVFYGVAFGGGQFAAVGDGGSVAVSRDGVGWLPQTTDTSATLSSIAYGNGEFVVVGRDGTVLLSHSVSAENWIATHYTPAERNDPEVGTLFADPGGFGVPNLLRYAFGLEATQPSRDGLPHVLVTMDEGVRYPAISYTRNIEAEDLTFVLEESTDLQVWTTVAEPVIVSVVTEGNLQTTVIRTSEPVDAAQGSGFLRLRVTVVP